MMLRNSTGVCVGVNLFDHRHGDGKKKVGQRSQLGQPSASLAAAGRSSSNPVRAPVSRVCLGCLPNRLDCQVIERIHLDHGEAGRDGLVVQ